MLGAENRPVGRDVVWRGFEEWRRGRGVGSVPPPQKNFGIFSFEMVHFDAFWKTMEVNCYNNILRLHMLNLSAKR